MTTRCYVAIMATLLTLAPIGAQTGAGLLQSGIYRQETMGDLSGAIQIYREVLHTPNISKEAAAQAQYQLVLCMLQKGDRPGAFSEFEALLKNFPDQQDFIAKARKLLPGASTVMSPPWNAGESSQLNIKRNGEFTGEYLYYSATPWLATQYEDARDPSRNRDVAANARAIILRWALTTKSSHRSVTTWVNLDTMTPTGRPQFESDDVQGDPLAEAFAGPALDATQTLMFRLRALPLGAGYKAVITDLPFVQGHGTLRTVELAVGGVENIQTVAGKFNCYKVSIAALGQTFWIGVDGTRPLVKFQSGNVEAELVRTWGPTALETATAFLTKAGLNLKNLVTRTGEESWGGATFPANGPLAELGMGVTMRRIYTPPAELDQALQRTCEDLATGDHKLKVRSSIPRMIGGVRSVTCVLDLENGRFDTHVVVLTENYVLRFSPYNQPSPAVFRWVFDPILDTIKLN